MLSPIRLRSGTNRSDPMDGSSAHVGGVSLRSQGDPAMRVATLRASLASPVRLASRVLLLFALITPVYLLSTHSPLWANAAGPPDAAPPSCSCHGSDAVKATIEITGLPATFTPGTTYTLTVKVSDPDRTVAANAAWGFEL